MHNLKDKVLFKYFRLLSYKDIISSIPISYLFNQIHDNTTQYRSLPFFPAYSFKYSMAS